MRALKVIGKILLALVAALIVLALVVMGLRAYNHHTYPVLSEGTGGGSGADESASISTARFITHARYLFVRLARGAQLDHGNSPLTKELLRAHPREMAIARKVAHVVELRFGQPLTDDEIAYLGLHVARLQVSRADE